ncbi:ATP-binding protein, partial [Candidatus Bathyarchaeota archaeon]
MKVLVCGKGGSGKSVITAMLARELARRGFKILVVDMDESNATLHRQLGFRSPRD